MAALGIAFFDLTESLRAGTSQGTLHLAPIDFHPNPRGNRVMAEAIAGRLAELRWVEQE